MYISRVRILGYQFSFFRDRSINKSISMAVGKNVAKFDYNVVKFNYISQNLHFVTSDCFIIVQLCHHITSRALQVST